MLSLTKRQTWIKDAQAIHAAAFKTQKPLSKKDVLKLKAGTWLEIKWQDSPNTVALLLNKTENHPGDVDLVLYHPGTAKVDYHFVIHSQVVRVLGPLQVPQLGQLKPTLKG